MLRRLLESFKSEPSRQEVRFAILRLVGRLIMPGYRFYWPQLIWWRDDEFNSILNRFNELKHYNTERRWMIYQMALMSDTVAGDTAECGVFRGLGSHLICKATQGGRHKRTHYMFDSFEGLSKPSNLDGNRYWREGDLSCSLENFIRPPGQISIHAGWIPEKFPEVADRRFSFVHLDLDLYQPTLDSIKFFYPRMVPDGILLLDDYGYTTCPGVRQAVDEFMVDKPERIIDLACGSAIVRKAQSQSINPSEIYRVCIG